MKPPIIKDITRKDLREYFDYINGDALDSIWNQSQADTIGEMMCEENLIIDIIEKMKNGAPDGFTILDSYLSMVVFGFQCGREFEFGQMVKAMRNEEWK